jgi:SAM-dependent methyltransferase
VSSVLRIEAGKELVTMKGVGAVQHSANYDFIIRQIAPSASVLDFGCGNGETVALARAWGLNVVGADTYDRKWSTWLDEVAPAARPFVGRIENGRLPYPDASFDCVFANMVFEHIPWQDVPGALQEIRRVLKPGGQFIALFPTTDAWYEGHVGVYFAHWMMRWPRLQAPYLRACYHLGVGLHRNQETTAAAWARQRQKLLSTSVFFHSLLRVRQQWADVFGKAPSSFAAEYMRFRLGISTPALDRLLAFVCHRRAGAALVVTRSA